MWPFGFGVGNKYPYSDFHELNTDFLIQKCAEIAQNLKDSITARKGAETAQAAAEAAQEASETAQEAAETAQAGAETAQAGAETAETNTRDYYNNLATHISDDVTGWLAANVTPVGSAVVVDSSLSISGAAADAKVTGDLKSELIEQVNYYSNEYRPLYTGSLQHGTHVVALPIAKGATYRCKNESEGNTTYSISLCTKDNTLIEQLGAVSTGITREFVPQYDSSYIRLYTSADDNVVTAIIECVTDVPFRLSETEATSSTNSDEIANAKTDITENETHLNGLAIGLMNVLNSLAYVTDNGKNDYETIMKLVGIKGVRLLDGYLASATDGALIKQQATKTRQTTDLYEISENVNNILIKGNISIYSVIRCYDENGAFLGTATTSGGNTGISADKRFLITNTKYIRIVLCNNSAGTGEVGNKYTQESFVIEEFTNEQIITTQKIAFIIDRFLFPAYIYDLNGNKYIPAPRIEIFNDPFNSINNNFWSFRTGNYQNKYYMPADYSQNAYIEDGQLIIKNIKNNPTPDFEWSGAFIESEFKYSFMYGRLDARIKFPSDSPLYHATLWMMGNNHSEAGFGWPLCGEIDIAEADNGIVTCTVHYGDSLGNPISTTIGTFSVNASEYHVYSMEWTEKYIAIYCDGEFVGNFETELATIELNGEEYNPFRQPFYIMFNCNPYGLQDTENTEANEVTCYIDYINIYD